ncbi:hypothetical protein [Vibrio sp. D431a]|uniref:hypothetical protein n=1 Tax=Vibrio sp. D431a TaxID=2837388 RepID=UPI002552DBAA|nr:hypothetical protein [Vibrio sp. D431a]MDK9793274.1 hypothetical protein [Vibrio sp. D431a]
MLAQLFELPYAFFGVPTLLLIILIFAGFILGFLDFDFDVESDLSAGGFSHILLSTGVSRVPLTIGLLASFAIAYSLVCIIYDYLLLPYVTQFADVIIYILHLPILLASLFIAGGVFKALGVDKIFKANDSATSSPIIGCQGYATSSISSSVGTGIVQVREGAISFSARTIDDNDTLNIGDNFVVISKVNPEDSSSNDELYFVKPA